MKEDKISDVPQIFGRIIQYYTQIFIITHNWMNHRKRSGRTGYPLALDGFKSAMDKEWWTRPGLNRRPSPCKGDVITTRPRVPELPNGLRYINVVIRARIDGFQEQALRTTQNERRHAVRRRRRADPSNDFAADALPRLPWPSQAVHADPIPNYKIDEGYAPALRL